MSLSYGMNQGYPVYASPRISGGWPTPNEYHHPPPLVVYSQSVKPESGFVIDGGVYDRHYQSRGLFRPLSTAYDCQEVPTMVIAQPRIVAQPSTIVAPAMVVQPSVIPKGLIPENYQRLPLGHEKLHDHRREQPYSRSHDSSAFKRQRVYDTHDIATLRPDEEDDDKSGCGSVEDATTKKGKIDAIIKGPWTLKEDQRLCELVEEHGLKWSFIARKLKGRIGKQCRERYVNHLNKGIKKCPWSALEDQILLEAQEKLGNRWSEISKLLPGRPENSVKNRYNCLIMRKNN